MKARILLALLLTFQFGCISVWLNPQRNKAVESKLAKASARNQR
ncbi:MAG: hypothetical protein ACRD16_12775 [Thermoanaerobaculia bacterium]